MSKGKPCMADVVDVTAESHYRYHHAARIHTSCIFSHTTAEAVLE